jgi:cyclopropane fatty-acyl-phospholipid synthase-like methyltransferase
VDERAIRAARGPFAGRRGQIDAPYLPSSPSVVEQMLDLAGVGPGDRLIDLGCGDGRIVLAAARRGATALGVDLDPERVARARRAAAEAGLDALATFRVQDLFRTSLAEASVVTMFLLAHVNCFLEGRLRTRLRPGARVVSHLYSMRKWAPDTMVELEGRRRLYLWVVPSA